MRKANSPAQWEVTQSGKVMLLCQRHMERELKVEGTTIKRLPDGANINCQQCYEDRMVA